jgi:biotin operon repressor
MATNDEEIGFHKGAISTLIKERQEVGKILGIVDTLLKAHVEALKKLGIDITKAPESTKEKKKK